jgi:hypothetical protein
MEKNTKIILGVGLAAAVVVGYIVYKSKNPKSSKCTGEFSVECNDGSCDVSNGIIAPCLGKGGEKGTGRYQFVKGSDEEKAFSDATYERYMIGGTPNNGDVITTKFGSYVFILTKKGVAPSYYNDGYWEKN